MARSEFPLLGFDPFVELRRMQSEMNRLFSGFSPATRDFPPINIWLGDNSVVVTSELPGVTRNDVTINLQEDMLTLEGASARPRSRMSIGSVASALTVGSRALSNFHSGLTRTRSRPASTMASLEIELERLEADRPKKIAIRAA